MLLILKEQEAAGMIANKMQMDCRMHMCMQMCTCRFMPFACRRGIR